MQEAAAGSLTAPRGCTKGAAPGALQVLGAAHGSWAQGAADEKAQEMSAWESKTSSPHPACDHWEFNNKARTKKNILQYQLLSLLLLFPLPSGKPGDQVGPLLVPRTSRHQVTDTYTCPQAPEGLLTAVG